MIKRLLLVASTNKRLEKLVSTSRLTRGLVSRFVAGTTLEDAIAVTRELQAQKIDVSLDLLGETVSDLAESATATKAYIEAVRAIAEQRPGRDGVGEAVAARASGWTPRSAPATSTSCCGRRRTWA